MSDTPSETNPEESVGYGRPPKATQWKPGQSGNPKGKAKGLKSLKKIVQNEAASKIVVKEGGKSKTMTKAEVVLKALWSKAMQSDVKAILAVMTLLREMLPADTVEVSKAGLSVEDQKILSDHAAFLKLTKGDSNGGD
jgi:hypothetical protein